MSKEYRRPVLSVVETMLMAHGLQHLQILIGPRQVGKTWAARQLAASWPGPVHFAAADEMTPPRAEWLRQQWQQGQLLAQGPDPALLILDEVQKIPQWTQVVKSLWDQDAGPKRRLRVLLLGSSALLMQKGLHESLAGRFYLHRFHHWSWPEMQQAFGYSLQDWLNDGGYPGAASLRKDPAAWQSYLRDSIIETVLSRDVLQLQVVKKPALLRHLFLLACAHPAQILSYNKMLGQLTEVGNTTTLAHYLSLLQTAFVAAGLQPWSGNGLRHRAGSPKLLLMDNGLIQAAIGQPPVDADTWRGRLLENAVGAHLLRQCQGPAPALFYWRQGNDEVDFVLTRGPQLWAIEVKAGDSRRLKGLQRFQKLYPKARTLHLGPGGLPLEKFFSQDLDQVLGAA